MKNEYSPSINNLIVPPVGGSSAMQSSLYKIDYDNTAKVICVKPLDDIYVSFKGKEYAVDWNKFIKDYCTEV